MKLATKVNTQFQPSQQKYNFLLIQITFVTFISNSKSCTVLFATPGAR